MSKDEALDLALEALEEAHHKIEHKQDTAKREQAITAIKQARSAPVQEPVAWPCVIAEADFEKNTVTLEMQCSDYKVGAGRHWLHTTPPKRPAPVQKPVHQWRQKHSPYWYDGYPDNDDGGGPYETRILYTTPPAQPAPVQEPVAMRMPKVGDKVVCFEDESIGTIVYLTAGGSPEIKFDDGSHGTYMLREFAELFGYITPPAAQRQWVGLTDEERVDLWKATETDNRMVLIDAVLTKLKEKNT